MKKASVVLFVMSLVAAGLAWADNALIDYQGYAWETGGFPISAPNDTLRMVGIVDSLDTRFNVNLANDEVTLYVSQLVSSGQVIQGGGIIAVAYSNSPIELHQDPSKNHDFGTGTPPNGTSPNTFVDGPLFLGGTLTNFFLFFDPSTGSGAYEGDVTFTSGSGLATLNQLNANGFTFGGALGAPAVGHPPIPGGYDLQVDGTISLDVPVGVRQSSWSQVKELYRQR
jgi:hypothetical protein